MAKTHSVQIIVEIPKRHTTEKSAWEVANKMVADLKKQYPSATIEPHVWEHS